MFGRSSRPVATMIGCLPMQALLFLVVFAYATQAIAFEWKPGFRLLFLYITPKPTISSLDHSLYKYVQTD